MANTVFDPNYNLVTSYLLRPSCKLAPIRLLVAFYTLAVLVFMLVWEGTKTKDIDSFFSYFTNLSYIGLCAYFFASGVQTAFYAYSVRFGKPVGFPLQKWPRFLQYLHVLLLSTVLTFPILVTIVYWALLASSSTFATPYSSWANISRHALNSVFALFEILLTNVPPMPWINLPVTLVFLGGYLGVAYITHATQGIYTYSFLNPSKGKKLAVYIVGIAVAQCVVFFLVRGVVSIRTKVTSRNSQELEKEKLVQGN